MTWSSASDYLARLQATLTTGTPATDPPDAVVAWLARLRLLEGVPFFHLVPDARMLPPESLRFFQVDPNWIEALLDGAFSIGRYTTGDAAREASRTAAAKAAALRATATLRTRDRARAVQSTAWIQASLAARTAPDDPSGTRTPGPAPEADRAAPGARPLPAANTTGDSGGEGGSGTGGASSGETLAGPQVTGFVLRSAVVSGWPGMEVRAYTDAAMTQPAGILRLDRLADDVLFGLFGQEVAAIQFSEPAETLHFGFEIPDQAGGPYVKILKYVNATGQAPGSEMTGVSVNAPFRDASLRVVDVRSLASTLNTTLVSNGGMGTGDPWTAAEFALEMVQGVEEVNYTVEAS